MLSETFFSYTFDGDIHHITAHQNTNEALDAVFHRVEGIFESLPMEEKARIMLDFRQVSIPPLSQWLMPVVAFLRRPGRKTGHPARIAFLYSQHARGASLNSFLAIQRFWPTKAVLRLFSEVDRDKALEWVRLL